jgi:GT2 family glycosyltransferase
MTSICISSYNNVEFFEKWLKSIFNTVKPFTSELIVAHNREEKYFQLINKATQYYQVTDIIINEPVGISKAYNTVLSNAIVTHSSDFIAVCGDDSEVLGNWLTDLSGVLSANSDIGVACGLDISNRDSDNHYTNWGNNQISESNLDTFEAFKQPIIDVIYPAITCCMYRRDALLKSGLYDENFTPYGYDDTDLGVRMWLAGYRSVLVPKVRFYHYRGVASEKILNGSYWAHNQALYFENKWNWLLGGLTEDQKIAKLSKIAEARRNNEVTEEIMKLL